MTNHDRLLGPRIKLVRAAKHLAELRAAVEAYLASRPFLIVKRDEQETSGLVFIVNIRTPVPPEWGAVIGDVVHNARSALDLLAWQLVLAAGSTPSRRTRFPVESSSLALTRALPEALSGASPAAHTFVERLRPYRGGNATLLQLHTLNIIDKHRLILTVGAAHTSVIETLRMPPLGTFGEWLQFSVPIVPKDRQFPLADAAEVFRIKAAARDSTFVSENPRFTIEIAFAEGAGVRGQSVAETLTRILQHIEMIIESAAKELFEGQSHERRPSA